MSLRFITTPISTEVTLPEIREGGFPKELLPACLTPSGSESALAKLRQPGVLAVTTGQQPGLFTGPLYTIHKALSAAAFASLLEKRWGRPVVPLFWIAGDDHDFAEANNASWVGPDGAVVTQVLRVRTPDAPLTPMYKEPLGPEIEGALASFAAAIPASEFRDPTLAWLTRHYTPGQTVAGSFAGALAELLTPLGIVCFDSTNIVVKRAAARHLIKALGLAAQLDHDLVLRHQDLVAAGKDPGVSVGDGATLVMLEGKLGRDRLIVEGTGFATRRGGERFAAGELDRLAAESPERFSPNVLLRPVLESALLPTVGYVAGPGELRYLELTLPIYQRMRIPRQAPLPRWSGLLVEPKVDRVLEKFQATIEQLMVPGQGLETRIAKDQLPAEAALALQQLRQSLTESYGILGKAAGEIDLTMTKPVQGAMHKALAESNDIEKRLIQHLKKRQETEAGQIAKARNTLLPLGKPQERVLTVAPFLARHGPQLLTDLRDDITAWYTRALVGASRSS